MSIYHVSSGRNYGAIPIKTYNRRNIQRFSGSSIDLETRKLNVYKYSKNCIDVFYNRQLLVPNIDYTADDGVTIEFLPNVSINSTDIIVVYSWFDNSTTDTSSFPRQEILLKATEENQTTFNVTYDSGNLSVYKNGLRLSKSEYSANDGKTLTLVNGVPINTTILCEVWENNASSFDIDNTSNVKLLTEKQVIIDETTAGSSISVTYDVAFLAVYKNRQRLYKNIDYSATNGTTITFNESLVSGDVILIETYNI